MFKKFKEIDSDSKIWFGGMIVGGLIVYLYNKECLRIMSKYFTRV